MAAEILLDSNVVLRLLARGDRQHVAVESAVGSVLVAGFRPRLVPQVVMESWVVLTRPVAVNGFGWSVAETAVALEEIIRRFPLLPETGRSMAFGL